MSGYISCTDWGGGGRIHRIGDVLISSAFARFAFAVFLFLFSALFFPASGFAAGQTITINSAVTDHYVFGNGAGSEGRDTSSPYDGSNLTDPDNNKVIITGNGSVSWTVYGGYIFSTTGNVSAKDNNVTLQSGGKVFPEVYGAWSESWFATGTAVAAGNSVIFDSVTLTQTPNVRGAYTASRGTSSTVEYNTITITNNAWTGDGGIEGGKAACEYPIDATRIGSANALYNEVIIKDSTFSNSSITGGMSHCDTGTSTASHNMVTISGSTLDGSWGSVYGGFGNVYGSSGTAAANYNIVNFSSGSISQ